MGYGGVVAVRTDAGMLECLVSAILRVVNGYDAWEQYVNDRLQDAIANGELVPVNVGRTGPGEFESPSLRTR